MTQASWAARRAEAHALLESGQPMEVVKLAMRELKGFAENYAVHAYPVDTSAFYSDPRSFGPAFRDAGAPREAVDLYADILVERGIGFLALSQPDRALKDLDTAADLRGSAAVEARHRDALERARAETAAAFAAERRLAEARRVPVTVLTGFLGAGKTTLLNHILSANHGMKYAVIENEVGQIAIDNQLLGVEGQAMRTAETIVVLDNGCLCCTVRDDLIVAIKQILNTADMRAANARAVADGGGGETDRPPLDGILIETTGLADPGPVCKTFYSEPEIQSRARLDGVLTVVDAPHFLRQLRRERSFFAVNESDRQVAFADRLLLNKVDAVDEAALQLVEAEIRSINGCCPVWRCSLAKRPGELPLSEIMGSASFSLDGVLRDFADEEHQPQEPPAKRQRNGSSKFKACAAFVPLPTRQSRHDQAIRTFSVELQGAPLVLERFMEVMNALRVECAVDLYRYKGVVCVRERTGALKRAVLQGVHDMCTFEPRGLWPAGTPYKSQIVFIGKSLDAALWSRLLEKTKVGVLDE